MQLAQRIAASFLFSWYRLHARILDSRAKLTVLLVCSLVLVLLALSFTFLPNLQTFLVALYPSNDSLDNLRRFFAVIGSALVGATAIVGAFVLFALQTNFERLPYGLFKRLGSDPRLLLSFFVASVLGMGIAGLSTLTSKDRLGLLALLTAWATMAVFVLFAYAYRRALLLINPVQQLRLLSRRTSKHIRTWSVRADRLSPLITPTPVNQTLTELPGDRFDVRRASFLTVNSHWAIEADSAIQHAMSLARAYGIRGDYEVSREALGAVCEVSEAYLAARKQTFLAPPFPLAEPSIPEQFINRTLEQLRLFAHYSTESLDEQQLALAFRTMSTLCAVYLRIEYSSDSVGKYHSFLAAGYLSTAVEAVVKYQLADVLLEGLRLIGGCATSLLAADDATPLDSLVASLASVATAGCTNEGLWPIAKEGLVQLSSLTIVLLQRERSDIGFLSKEIHEHACQIATVVLSVQAPSPSSAHTRVLSPYFSSSNPQSLLGRLRWMTTSLQVDSRDRGACEVVISHIAEWSRNLREPAKDVLILAIRSRSFLAYEMIGWFTGLSEILIRAASAPDCNPSRRETLIDRSEWLLAALTFVPDDEDSLTFLENLQFVDRIFRTALCGHALGLHDFTRTAFSLLVSCALKGTKHLSGTLIFENGLSLAITLAVVVGDPALPALLKQRLAKGIGDEGSALEAVWKLAEADLHERMARVGHSGTLLTSLQRPFSQTEEQQAREMLAEIASLFGA